MARADIRVDGLYRTLRERYGARDVHANGYRSQRWFRREQAIVLECLAGARDPIVDIGCGSGLMLAPLLAQGRRVFGIDFNAQACRAALANGVTISRADAFRLPYADAALGGIVSCQFFNQQSANAVDAFLREVARTLAPGARAVLVWRNGAALVHRIAHAVFTWLDRARGMPVFPCVEHPLERVATEAQALGLSIETQFLYFAAFDWRMPPTGSFFGAVLGASCVLVLTRPPGAGA